LIKASEFHLPGKRQLQQAETEIEVIPTRTYWKIKILSWWKWQANNYSGLMLLGNQD
jgi:hypothetical protein